MGWLDEMLAAAGMPLDVFTDRLERVRSASDPDRSDRPSAAALVVKWLDGAKPDYRNHTLIAEAAGITVSDLRCHFPAQPSARRQIYMAGLRPSTPSADVKRRSSWFALEVVPERVLPNSAATTAHIQSLIDAAGTDQGDPGAAGVTESR